MRDAIGRPEVVAQRVREPERADEIVWPEAEPSGIEGALPRFYILLIGGTGWKGCEECRSSFTAENKDWEGCAGADLLFDGVV